MDIHDALGLLGKLREKAQQSGANRGLQAMAANEAIAVIRAQYERIRELEDYVASIQAWVMDLPVRYNESFSETVGEALGRENQK